MTQRSDKPEAPERPVKLGGFVHDISYSAWRRGIVDSSAGWTPWPGNRHLQSAGELLVRRRTSDQGVTSPT